jgi:hypothetical protein
MINNITYVAFTLFFPQVKKSIKLMGAMHLFLGMMLSQTIINPYSHKDTCLAACVFKPSQDPAHLQ